MKKLFKITLAYFVASSLIYLASIFFFELVPVGNGVILASLLGGFTAYLLLVGGPKRIASFAGFVLGVFAGWLLWQWAGSYSWVISTLLTSAFGEGAEGFTSLVALMLLFGMMRAVADLGTGWLKRLLVWSAKRRMAQVGMKEAGQPS